jgi:hypothetical protein
MASISIIASGPRFNYGSGVAAQASFMENNTIVPGLMTRKPPTVSHLNLIEEI